VWWARDLVHSDHSVSKAMDYIFGGVLSKKFLYESFQVLFVSCIWILSGLGHCFPWKILCIVALFCIRYGLTTNPFPAFYLNAVLDPGSNADPCGNMFNSYDRFLKVIFVNYIANGSGLAFFYICRKFFCQWCLVFCFDTPYNCCHIE